MIYVLSGGGAALNFKVAAYASADVLPTTAAENTIAVITETAISSWVMQAEEPEAPEAGMVWIYVGAPNVITIQAVKKPSITVYPNTAKQYVDGAWVDVPLKCYQNGAWVGSWDGYYYNAPDECYELTGGWVVIAEPGLSTITKAEEYISFYMPASSGVSRLETVYPIDLTNIMAIEVDRTTSGKFGIMVSATPGVTSTADCAAYSNTTPPQLNVAELKGSYYVQIYIQNTSSSSSSTVRVSAVRGVTA